MPVDGEMRCVAVATAVGLATYKAHAQLGVQEDQGHQVVRELLE